MFEYYSTLIDSLLVKLNIKMYEDYSTLLVSLIVCVITVMAMLLIRVYWRSEGSLLHENHQFMRKPKFNNDPKNYESFKEHFQSLVNDDLPAVEKYQLLKGAVSGEANDLIQGIELNEHCYVTAWKLLDQRYKNQWLHVNTLITGIFEAKNCKKGLGSSYRKLAHVIEKNIRLLRLCEKDVKLNIDSWDPILVCIIMKKLDDNSVSEWMHALSLRSDPKRSTIPSLKELISFLKNKADILDAPQSFASTTKKTLTCLKCKDDHRLYDCKRFKQMSLAERRSFVNYRKLCCNCLLAGHTVEKCTSRYRCFKCNEKHCILLHEDTNTTLQNEGKNDPPKLLQEALKAALQPSSEPLVQLATNGVCVLSPSAAHELPPPLLTSRDKTSEKEKKEGCSIF